MKDKLLKILDEFYDLSEAGEENALAKILKISNKNPSEISDIVKELKTDDISIVYEALAADMKNWSDFFLNEAKRIIELAKKSDIPADVLVYLDEFINIDPEEFKYSDELVDMMKKELKNEHPAFRYWAMSMIADFRKEGDILSTKLFENHLTDPDWRLRYWAYIYLNEIRETGKYKLSLMDKIRSKILKPYKFN
ncbi:MAG: hypothetical protein DRJ07_00550 [Bacteroidetes bacterium]|nr:MAG: hypothetical protein DRJ07_00550 [Bacteroidota bacterium]